MFFALLGFFIIHAYSNTLCTILSIYARIKLCTDRVTRILGCTDTPTGYCYSEVLPYTTEHRVYFCDTYFSYIIPRYQALALTG